MGYRNIFIMNCDLASDLGKPEDVVKFLQCASPRTSASRFGVRGIECVYSEHADYQQLLHVSGDTTENVKAVGVTIWNNPEAKISLLRQFADELGYQISKKPTKKNKKKIPAAVG